MIPFGVGEPSLSLAITGVMLAIFFVFFGIPLLSLLWLVERIEQKSVKKGGDIKKNTITLLASLS